MMCLKLPSLNSWNTAQACESRQCWGAGLGMLRAPPLRGPVPTCRNLWSLCSPFTLRLFVTSRIREPLDHLPLPPAHSHTAQTLSGADICKCQGKHSREPISALRMSNPNGKNNHSAPGASRPEPGSFLLQCSA